MANITQNFVTASANVAGVGGAPPANALGGSWQVVASPFGQTDFLADLTLPAGITAAKVTITGTVTPSALGGGYSLQTGLQLCDAGSTTPGVLGPHQLWAFNQPSSGRHLLNATPVTVTLTWTLHPTDLVNYAARNLRFFAAMVDGTYSIALTAYRIDYTTDPSQPSSAVRPLTGPEAAAIADDVAATGVLAKVTDLPGTNLPSPSLGWSQNAGLSMPAAFGSSHVQHSYAAVDIPPTPDAAPLISAGLRHYRNAQTSGTSPSNTNQQMDGRIILWDRATNTSFGAGPVSPGLTQPQQLHEYNARAFWAGRGDGVQLNVSLAAFNAACAAGTLSVFFELTTYDEAPSESGFARQAFNVVALAAFATLIGAPPVTFVGCSVIQACFGHLCTDNVSIISLAGTVSLVAVAGSRSITAETATGASAYLANFKSNLIPDANNCIYSKPLPPNSTITPAGSSYAMNVSTATSDGQKRTFHYEFSITGATGLGPVDATTISV